MNLADKIQASIKHTLVKANGELIRPTSHDNEGLIIRGNLSNTKRKPWPIHPTKQPV